MNICYEGKYKNVVLKESFWDPVAKKYSSRSIERLGRLEDLLAKDPDAIAKLEARVAQSRAQKKQRKVKQLENRLAKALVPAAVVKDSAADNRTVMPGIFIYRQIWNKLGLTRKLRDMQVKTEIDFDLPKTLFYLTAARCLCPGSKLSQWNKRNQFLCGFDQIKLSHMYRSMDFLIRQKDQLTQYLNKQIEKVYKRSVTVALYDVTTFYFESQDVGELRNFGFSKDAKINQVQVVMGLLIDDKGIPIDYELYPGNTNEFGTLLPLLKKLKQEYNIKHVIVTADRGLCSRKNLSEIKAEGMEYVIAYRLRSASNDIKKLVLSDEGWIRYSSNRSSDLDISKYRITDVSQIWTEVVDGCKQNKTIQHKLLINYSAKRAQKDMHDRQRLIDKACRFVENPSLLKAEMKRGGKSFLSIDSAGLSCDIDIDKIQEAKRFDGYYGIAFSDPKMSVDEVLSIHHSLWQIEESFRISKSLFQARPCFHWKDDRVRAHFLICFMALVMHRLLERELELAQTAVTAERIVAAMQEARLSEIVLNQDETIYCKSGMNGDFETIAKAVGIDPLPRLATAADVKRSFKVKSLK